MSGFGGIVGDVFRENELGRRGGGDMEGCKGSGGANAKSRSEAGVVDAQEISRVKGGSARVVGDTVYGTGVDGASPAAYVIRAVYYSLRVDSEFSVVGKAGAAIKGGHGKSSGKLYSIAECGGSRGGGGVDGGKIKACVDC